MTRIAVLVCGNNHMHPQGVDESNPNVPAPDSSFMTRNGRLDLSSRPRCGQSEVRNNYE